LGPEKGFEDGNTLILSAGGLDHTITLFGVQAPAINQDYGLEAKNNAEALALGKRVKAIDKGHGAGVIILQGVAVLNDEMVRTGLGLGRPQSRRYRACGASSGRHACDRAEPGLLGTRSGRVFEAASLRLNFRSFPDAA